MRICSGAGCMGKCADDIRYCAECAADQTNAHKPSGHQRTTDDPMQQQYTTKRWSTFRRSVLQAYPFCAVCSSVSKVADHIVPARRVCEAFRAARLFPMDPWAGFYLLCNTQGLCHSCHNKKTKREQTEDYTVRIDALVARYRPKPATPASA